MNLDELRNGPTYHVQVFRTGRCRIMGPYAYHSYARDRDHEFTLYVSVIQGNGITALVDVGMASVAQMNRDAGFLMSEEIVLAPGEDVLSIVARAGAAPEAIDFVLLTHCHYDHCSNLSLFPNATVVIPARAWRLWHEDPENRGYLHAGFLDELTALKAEGRLRLLDEGMVVPGLGVRWVGGHSICSQFIYVNTQKGLVLFSGDTVQMYKNVELDDPVAICHDVVQCREALALVRTDVDVLLPGHDPEILSRFPGGRVA